MKNKHESTPKNNYLFPIHIFGGEGSGKSQLLNRFANNAYEESYVTTTGFDFKVKTLNVQNNHINLQVWDNPSSTKNKVVPASAFIVVYDCTYKRSFIEAQELVNELKSKHSDKPVTLVATKCDSPAKQVVEYREAKEFADSNDLKFFEVSAKKNSNVDAVFEAISLQLLDKNNVYKENKSGNLNPGQKAPASISNDSDDEKFRKKLNAYITKRSDEFTNTGKQYHWGARLFSWFQNENISAKNKLAAADKALKLLSNNDIQPQKKSNSDTFTMDEITTLSNGRLGTIMKEKLKSMKHNIENGEIRYFFDNSNGPKNY
ncbi:Ras family GTPase [Legionella sainthelensi]|uniref:Rab family GTPase n=1 Tax=Legionella sainthelensi TaxID=28087 RepID=UPI000F70A6AA|nr:Rab family GTPase [Legionella sainthelensi]VEB37110.1 Ras family GTPase [Legionella sainthelensi]